MFRLISRFTRGETVAGFGALAVAIALVLGSAAPGIAQAGGLEAAGRWGGTIDPEALQVLKGMTDYVGSLQRFSMHTENTFEDVLATGQKIQFHYSSNVVAQRPNKLRAERSDGGVSHIFVYDGETLSMYLDEQDFYANVEVPDNLDDFLHFARDALDLVPPAGDMVFSNAFELLTTGMTSGFVVGKAVIDGVSCDHIAFTTPVVDWQVWVADGDKPLPYKYVLTTRDDPAQPQSVTLISDWNTDPKIEDGLFEFGPPSTATQIEFIRYDVVDASAR